jgi:hypothetical protein
MVPETVNPQALQLQSTNFDAADGWMDFPSTDLGPEDFDTMTLGNVDGDKTKSGLMESETISFGFDFMNSGSTTDWAFDLELMTAGCIETSSVQLATMDFDAYYNCAIPGFTTASVSCRTTNVRSIDDVMTGAGVLEYPAVNVAAAYHHPMGLDNVNFSTRGPAMAGGQQVNSTGQFSQSPATPQLTNTPNLGGPQHAKSTHLASQLLPKQTRLGGNVKREPVTSDDWEDHRPFIEQLYITENVKLSDVMKILKAKFGFEATYVYPFPTYFQCKDSLQSPFHVVLIGDREKMYKTKITQWKLKKNYTAAEKEQLARDFKAHRDSGKGIPPLTLRNRPAKLDRIRRFCKQEKILEEICNALQSDSPYKENVNSSAKALVGNRGAATAQVIRAAVNGAQSSSSSSAQGLTQTLFDPERPFSTTSSIGRIELILLQTKVYHQSLFGSGTPPDTQSAATRPLFGNGVEEDGRTDLVEEWVEKLIYGVGALVQQRSAQGWRIISEACEMVHKVLEQQPKNLFALLFRGFNDDDWTFFPGLRTNLLRFCTKSSAGKLGCNHPVSVVLYHLQEQQIFTDAVRPVLEVLVDAFGENLGPANDDSWEIRTHYCISLIEQREYAAAESHALRFLKQSEEAFGQLDWHTRAFLRQLAIIHYQQEQYDLAEIEYQDILQRGREDLGNEFPDAVCIHVLWWLAWIYGVRGDFAQSEEYWRATLTGAIDRWGMEDQGTIYIIIQLEESFERRGMDPEAWLRQNFGISYI